MKGSYILIIHLPADKKIRQFSLKKGYYAYIGSAMNSVEARVARHMRKEKKLHWHIDYLLQHARIIDVIILPSKVKKECKIAKSINLPYIKNFGASDCSCPSHLFYLGGSRDSIFLFKSMTPFT